MKFSSVKIAPIFLCIILFALTLILACGKDGDQPYEAVDLSADSDTDDKAVKLTSKTIETLTTSFSPIQDAYVQSGQGYDQKIVRLEDGRRKSYLMFDLRKIASNEGSLVSVDLEFTISSDGGDGTVSVFKGKAGDWTEEKLSASSAPAIEVLLAKATDQYKIGQTKKMRLDDKLIDAGIITLVMTHNDGNDLAFASKEHPDEKGPKLIVSYKASIGSGSTGNDDSKEEEEEAQKDENKPIAASIYRVPSKDKTSLTVNLKAWNSKNQKDITSYYWDFGDGSSTTTKNPAHTYTEPGEYTVKLTVKNAEGFTDSTTLNINVDGSSKDSSGSDNGANGNSDSGSESASINIAAATSGSKPSSGQAPLTVDFKAWNSKNQKDITGYFWDFKDGSTTTTKNPTHTFSDPGNYEVKLSVKNAAGQTHSTTINIRVTTSTTNNSGTGGGNSSGGSGGNGSSSGGSDSSGSSGNASGNSGNYPSNAVFASSYGFKSGDATSAFKAAINSGSSYVVIDKQSSDWVIKPTKFFNLSNITIVFEPGVVLRAKSGAFNSTGDQMISLATPTGVTIEGNGATLKMNKSEYNNGEGRHGIGIHGGKDITIKDLIIKDSGGDGIFMSISSSRRYCEDITIDGVTCENNRRQGMTIVSGKDIYIRNSRFLNTKGTKPEAGVDLEPERTTDRLDNINFINCKFSNNDGAGLHLATLHMNGSSTPINIKVIDSEFGNNVKSADNGVGSEVYLTHGSYPVRGEVRFERVSFNGSTKQIIFSRKAHDSFRAVFKDCTARNVSTQGSRGVIELQASNAQTTLGGFVFDNFKMQYNRNVPFMEINAPNSNFTVRDITGDFDITEPNDNPIRYSGGYNRSNNQNVSIQYQH